MSHTQVRHILFACYQVFSFWNDASYFLWGSVSGGARSTMILRVSGLLPISGPPMLTLILWMNQAWELVGPHSVDDPSLGIGSGPHPG